MFYKLLVMCCFASALMFAQGRGGMGGGGGMGDDMGGGGGMGGGRNGNRGEMGEGNLSMTPHTVSRMDQISEALKLNKEQKKEVRTILDEAQKEAMPIHEHILKSELAIGDAIQGGKSSDDLKPLIASEAGLQAQMTGIEMNAFAKIYKLLDKDQVTQSRAVFSMMKGIFNGKSWNSPE